MVVEKLLCLILLLALQPDSEIFKSKNLIDYSLNDEVYLVYPTCHKRHLYLEI